MDKVNKLILVVGATGSQGKATALELLRSGFKVRAQAFKSDTTELENAGAEIVRGNFDDLEFVAKAMEGVYGVFSMQNIDFSGGDAETKHAQNLVNAAVKAGVKQVVHTSLGQAGNHEKFPGWHDGVYDNKFWTEKANALKAILDARFEYCTILKPMSFMNNYIPPMINAVHPNLKQGEIFTTLKPDTKLYLIAPEDIGKFAAAAFIDPQAYNGKSIELAGDSLTITEFSEKLGKAINKNIHVVYVSQQEFTSKGGFPLLLMFEKLLNEAVYQIDFEKLKQFGIHLTTFDEWLAKNKNRLEIKS